MSSFDSIKTVYKIGESNFGIEINNLTKLVKLESGRVPSESEVDKVVGVEKEANKSTIVTYK